MKTSREVIDIIKAAYPEEYALSFDNVGLLVGRMDKPVKCVYIALDATDEVIEEAASVGADLLITHHPMIFTAMKQIRADHFIGRRILKLAENDISYYAMHTNYDVVRMGPLAADLLGMKEQHPLEVTWSGMSEGAGREPGKEADKKSSKEPGDLGIGVVGCVDAPISIADLCARTKEAFDLPNVKVFGGLNREVQKIAVCPGSGKGVIEAALEKGADVLITGDIDHHEGIDAWAQNLSIIDAGHYGVEHIYIEDMHRFIEKEIPELEVHCAKIAQPFVIK